MRVALYVQHLLGTGHLVRMLNLGQALHSAGHSVLLLSGGQLQATAEFACVQLPILKTMPGDFLTLLDQNNHPVGEDWKAKRQSLLLKTVSKFSPQVLVIETWPFGRRQMEFEILPLIEMVKNWADPPFVVSSIRDVLQQRKEKRRQQTLKWINQSIDLVVVHGEYGLTPLSASFPEAELLDCPVRYSGYITAKSVRPAILQNSELFPHPLPGADEILVSAGGGAVGEYLLQVAVEAAELDDRSWRLLAGPNLAESVFLQLQERAGRCTVVERNRPDFTQLLKRCYVSISQFGYNTAVDIMNTRCAAVVVPYAEDGETEQTKRAACFEVRGLVVSLSQEKLTPQTLLQAIEKATMINTVDQNTADLNGAQRSVEIIYQQFLDYQEHAS